MMAVKKKKSIRATNFYEFVRCPRKVYLYFFGDPQERTSPSEFMQKKFQEGKDFEKKIVKELDFVQPSEERSYEERYKETEEFMKKSNDLIYQGILIHGNLLGIPDLLEKKKGKSDLGDYYYQVSDVKSGRSIRQEYVMQLMFYSYLLEKVQGFMPPEAELILGDGSRANIKTSENMKKFSEIFERINLISEGLEEPVHIAGVCKECIWKNFCLKFAEKEKNISLIYNISKDHIKKLKEAGIKDLEDASLMDINKLKHIKGFSENSLRRWRSQAKSLLSKKDIKLESYSFPDDKSIYFDIEDTETEEGKVVYLFGLVEDDKYISFLAETPDQEIKAWNNFLDHFKEKENFRLYVYSGHEKSMVNKLFKKYGGDPKVHRKIITSIIDLLPIIKRSAVLPIFSYSIKDVAKYLGFSWTAEDAGGAQSMLWYDNWLENEDKDSLNKVLLYNEEDCRAMIAVKRYIESDNE